MDDPTSCSSGLSQDPQGPGGCFCEAILSSPHILLVTDDLEWVASYLQTSTQRAGTGISI